MAVVSFKPHWCDQYLHLQNANIDFCTPPVPLHEIFHLWSSRDAPVNVWRNTQSFLCRQPRGLSTLCCWAGAYNLHFVVVSQSHSPLEFVPLRWWWHTLPGQPAQPHKRSTLCRSYEKKSKFQWGTHEHPVCQFFMRYKRTPSATLYGSSSHQSFTFLLPLQVPALAKTWSPGPSEMALAFLLYSITSDSQPLTWAALALPWGLLTVIHVTQQCSYQCIDVSLCPSL